MPGGAERLSPAPGVRQDSGGIAGFFICRATPIGEATVRAPVALQKAQREGGRVPSVSASLRTVCRCQRASLCGATGRRCRIGAGKKPPRRSSRKSNSPVGKLLRIGSSGVVATRTLSCKVLDTVAAALHNIRSVFQKSVTLFAFATK